MTVRKPDFETLNAYVDGELDAEATRQVETCIAEDEATARQVATLVAMKRAVSGLVAETAVVIVAPERRRPRKHAFLAAAAGLVAALAVAWGVSGASLPAPSKSQEIATLDRALARYDSWVADGAHEIGTMRPVADFDAPRLDAAGLFPAIAESDVPLGPRRASHVGFVGQHGCHVSLFSWPEPAGDDALKLELTETVAIANWRTHGRHFMLVARKMNSARFTTIAGAMRELTGSGLETSAQTTARLAEAHQPCVSTG
ncbi:MAG TPA: hypothetical protein GX405_05410 [Rhizobiales bacterium]|nr:hypothetical protein [Hyphomicrobiales bacterium]